MRAAGNRKFVKHRSFSQTAGALPFANRGRQSGRRLGLHLLGLSVTVALLAYLGPFGTWTSLGLGERLVFWGVSVGANWLIAPFVSRAAIRVFSRKRWPSWAGVALAGLVSALPGTGAVWLMVAAYLDFRPAGIELAGLYAKVAVFHLIIGCLVFYLIEQRLRGREARGAVPAPPAGGPHAAPDPAPHAAPAAPLLARLPARSRGELLHLRMQDHYVEVHTAGGMDMLLLRFRDALREVEGLDGMQVHRSHWVARAAVAAVERRSGRVNLRLVNGSRIPVSRSFVPALKAQGWL